MKNIHLGAKLEGIYRKDIYELPPDSIRELIINAVMNCSYLQSSHIQVAIYDDRLEITSPGGLMPGVTLDKMREGYSKIRNRALAHAFSYMNLIEAWGSGIPKLLEAMKEYGLREPEFQDLEIGFSINLYRNVEDATRSTTQSTTRSTTRSTTQFTPDELENAILKLMSEESSISQKKIAIQLAMNQNTVKYHVRKMLKNGVIMREGTSRKGKWIVK